MKPGQVAGLLLLVIGVLFVVGLIPVQNYCFGSSIGGICVGLSIPTDMLLGFTLIVVGAMIYLRGGHRRGLPRNLQVFVLFMLLVGILVYFVSTSSLSVSGGSSTGFIGQLVPAYVLVVVLVAAIAYKTRRKGR